MQETARRKRVGCEEGPGQVAANKIFEDEVNEKALPNRSTDQHRQRVAKQLAPRCSTGCDVARGPAAFDR